MAETALALATEAATARHRSGAGLLQQLRRYPLAMAGALFVLCCAAAAIFAPLITSRSVQVGDLFSILAGPSTRHWLGTDATGRDTYTRLIYGTRVSLEVAFASVGLGLAIGIPIGLVAAYAGGAAEAVIIALLDAVIAFPALVLALALVAVFGPGVAKVTLAIAIVGIPVYGRVVRAEALSVSRRDYVVASRATGASHLRIMARHILPNSLSPLIVQGSVGLGAAVLAEAGLSFLGVGVRPPQPTWGAMLQEGFQYIHQSSWVTIFPGLAIFLLVLSFNFVGDALRDRLDPRLRGR